MTKTVDAATDRDAEDELARWRKELDRKVNPGIKVPCSLLLENKIAAMRRRGRDAQNIQDQELKIAKHLLAPFGHREASEITLRDINKFIDKKLKEKAAPASINRMLANLRCAFSIGVREGLITDPLPIYQELEEKNVRQGFIEDQTYRAMLALLPTELQMLFCFAYYTGMRKGELVELRWSWLQPYWGEDEPIIKIPGTVTKSGDPHTIPIYHPEMRAFVEMAMVSRNPRCPFLFQYKGERLTDHQRRKGWDTARKTLGLPDLYLHDTRRTAIRLMEKAGIPRHDAMQITGHKTESIYKRYDIANEKGAVTAGAKMRGYFELQEKAKAQKLRSEIRSEDSQDSLDQELDEFRKRPN